MDPEPDTRIGSLVDDRYSILEAMAAGSMGAVYKAERVPVGKLVAIKFLHASYATDAEFLARFERETRVMSKLAHPNCVSVVDFGVWRDSPYLVMEFVSGTTLRAVIDDVSIEPARALTLARQIAIGLAHAHSHGIVHRDVKPANIMITEQLGTGESVRILDFGLARLRDSTGTGRDPTLHNVVVGTPNYMAPEQTVAGGKVDERTDVYAAGVVLYEMIVGEKPFAAEDTLSLLAMHRAAPIPRLANHVDGDLPDGLQELVDRAMAKDPADRYQTALALAEAIEAVAAAPAGSAKRRHTSPALGVAPTLLDVGRSEVKPAAASRAWRKPVLGAVILLGGAAATAGYLIHRAAADEAAFDANVVTVAPRDAATPLAVIAGDAEAVAVAPLVPDAESPDAALAVATPDAEVVEPSDAAVTVAAAVADAQGPDAADEIEMDPMTADDPDPAAPVATKHVEEAADAPKTDTEIEKRAPVAPVLAPTVAAAIQQIKDGNRPAALASLRALGRKQSASAYIPFLLGNLYFDERWWSVAMDHYRKAIMKNPAYKNNPVINQNVVQMLASPKTQSFAVYFLRTTIGHPALPYVKYAAAHSDNPIVRKQSAVLAKLIH